MQALNRSDFMLLVAALFLTSVVLYYFPRPYIYFSILWAIVCLAASIMAGRSWAKALWINLAVVVFTFGAMEAYFWAQEPLERQMDYSEEFFISDDVLGYKPTPEKRIEHRSYGGNRLLYDVTYTLDDQGLRIASPLTIGSKDALPCFAFFGDSFTFGEGMADEQTMPYQVWKRIGPRYRTVNFAFLGYGPHQMLAALEQGQVGSHGHCTPSHIVYQAIPSHVSRAAGLEAWDHHGPRYLRQSDGQLRRAGHFDDLGPSTPHEWLRHLHWQLHTRVRAALEASALYRTLLNSHRPVTSGDVALFAAIVKTAKLTASRVYPDVTFQVLFWDFDDDAEVGQQVMSQLHVQGVTVHPMSKILPGFPIERARYEISPYDRHPNEEAHARIADFVAQRLVHPRVHDSLPHL